ncbi:MAG TPA: SCO family protein [Ktedonobacterales bacterium]|nr:SCO family protein [Ktedonobacterales bacterium]
MKLRTLSRVIVGVLVVLVGGAIVLHERATTPSATPRPTPTLVAGSAFTQRAPDFQLNDQNGAPVSLARLRGHPIVLTFVDATCTTECPITAQELDWTAQDLGDQAAGVIWLAITVNPNDTLADVRQFMTKNKVTVPLRMLLGTQTQLAPIWKAYGIEVIPSPTDVTHTVATYLIDARGNERELLSQPIDPRATAQDLRTLLAEAR